MKLHEAMTLAERIQREIEAFCEPGRCAIAGSVRRGRPEVNDIDFVVLPKPGQEPALRERCKRTADVISEGPKVLIVRLKNGMQVDFYFAVPETADLLDRQPSNFGAILLIRTGSKEHNIKLAEIAKNHGLALKAGVGVFGFGEWRRSAGDTEDVYEGGRLIASETEEQIFEALGMQWIAPALRETAMQQHRPTEETNVSQPITA